MTTEEQRLRKVLCEWDLGDIQFNLKESCMVITDLADFRPCITKVIRKALDYS